MNVIYKYPLSVAGEQLLDMPKGANILTVAMQRGAVYIWAIVDPEAAKEQRTIAVIGAGHPLGDLARLDYIGSVQADYGQLILHVFERLGAT